MTTNMRHCKLEFQGMSYCVPGFLYGDSVRCSCKCSFLRTDDL